MVASLLRFLLVVGSLATLFLASLVAYAWFASPAPPIDQALAGLVPGERTALEALARQAGFAPASMHALGGYYRGLLDAPVNRRALWIEDGHVRALRIAGWPQADAPDLAAFRELEVLWLDDGALAEWPDLSRLAKLRELVLREQPLTRIDGARLPPALVELGLAGTGVEDVAPLATLGTLRELDLSETAVARIDALLPLALDTLDLAGSRIAELPATLPRRVHGDWSLNLDGTPLLTRPDLSWQAPAGYAFVNSALGRERREGYVGSGNVDAWGEGEAVPSMRPVQLNTRDDRGGVYDVEVEASIASGRARIWMHPPDDYWWKVSPWFGQVDIRGFGFPPRASWVRYDLEAGQPVRVNGRLMRAGSSEHPQMEFLIEPLDGTQVTGLRYHVRKRDARR